MDPDVQIVLTTPDLATSEIPAMVSVADGGVLTGSGRLLSIWATEYNKRVSQGLAPKNCAKHAVHKMLLTGKMSDIHAISYQAAVASDPGAPSTFNFDPGQYFPTNGQVTWQEANAQLNLAISIAMYNIWAGIIVLIAFIIIDLIVELINIFEGKPVAEDTYTVGQRLTECQNPAASIIGVELLRNLSQNGIVLSSGDPGDQKILGGIRQHGYALLIAQGQTAADAKALIDYVWTSSNLQDYVPPGFLKTWPQPSGGGNTGGGNKPQPSIPGWQVLASCFPQPPTPDGSLDEVGQYGQLAAWGAQTIAIAILNVYQAIANLPSGQSGGGGGGGSGTSDPVTCTQLTALMKTLVAAIEGVSGQVDPVTCSQLTELVTELRATVLAGDQDIADAIAALGAATPDANVKRIADSLNGFPPDNPDAAKLLVDLRERAAQIGFSLTDQILAPT